MKKIIAFILLGCISISYSNARDLRYKDFLTTTKFIDSQHPAVVSAMNEAIGKATSEKEKAVRIHDYVRDRIKFGWSSDFYDQSASEVLEFGVGFCNTKGTLFIAMLRAAGIPAKQHFVNINTDIIASYISPGTDYVDHSYTEVYLGERWVALDSYIVDLPLFERAKSRLEVEDKLIGYGIHLNGSAFWDGQSNSFSQFVDDGSFPEITTMDHGVYPDVGSFYASGKGLNN